MGRSATQFVEELFQRHDSALRRFLTTRVRPDEVPDLANECYLQLLRVADPSSIRHPRAFLMRTASNLAADRARRRAIEVTSDNLPSDPDEFPADSPRPEEVLSSDQLLSRIQEALAELPGVTARIFWKRRIEGISSTRIAFELGVTPRTVQKHIAAALLHLYERVGPLMPEAGE
ncbi:MAG: sigma-70 family RNA polymerase sigma factor [Gammaproteobacteria bacterium]|nr:sigma-70 family RNA polymerase sigma factor [Gammaproteobacteria bacterium]